MPTPRPDMTVKSIQAGLLSWILPGAGHYLLGHRGLALVFFAAITIPYWAGVAIGGIKDSINPVSNRWLFLAEVGVGGYTVPGFLVSRTINANLADRQRQGEYVKATAYTAFYPESDVAQIYLATAGLLNLLVILDAVARAQTGGQPTFYRDLPATEQQEHDA